MMQALGFIETKGLIGAIEAADAMLKAADVRLLEKNLAGGGLVSITVCGEVAAVQASIDAAVTAIGRIPGALLYSKNVIARPDTELTHIIATSASAAEAPAPKPAAPKAAPVAPKAAPLAPKAEQAAAEAPVAAKTVERHSHAQLKKMNVARLRQIALELQELSGLSADVAAADKKALIEIITNSYRQIEE